MPVAATSSIPAPLLAALSAVQQAQAAELAVATKLEQGFEQAAASANPGLGQVIDVTA
jgi:hypothetical protein